MIQSHRHNLPTDQSGSPVVQSTLQHSLLQRGRSSPPNSTRCSAPSSPSPPEDLFAAKSSARTSDPPAATGIEQWLRHVLHLLRRYLSLFYAPGGLLRTLPSCFHPPPGIEKARGPRDARANVDERPEFVPKRSSYMCAAPRANARPIPNSAARRLGHHEIAEGTAIPRRDRQAPYRWKRPDTATGRCSHSGCCLRHRRRYRVHLSRLFPYQQQADWRGQECH